MSVQNLMEKWSEVLDHESYGKIQDHHRKAVTAQVLENQMNTRHENAGTLTESPTNGVGGVANWDPVLISLVRRTLPNLMAYDLCGVQPMTMPTGLIFAMRSRYGSQNGTEAFYNEANTAFSGTGTHNSNDPFAVDNVGTAGVDESYQTGHAMATSAAEALGNTGSAFGEMALSIEKVTVTAKSRALKANYSVELAQDMKSVHGLDAEGELSNILSQEILAEMNREIVRSIYGISKIGAQNATSAGVFDLNVDSDGRWEAEKFKSLLYQIEREANTIAKETRRGRGNVVICSSDVASALALAGVLDFAPALGTDLKVDDTGNTFVGILNGRFKVFVDPYLPILPTGGDIVMVGYKGQSAYDAGLYFCPYVALQLMKAVGPDDFQPRLGLKTRYGIVANPFAGGIDVQNGALTANANCYFRKFAVKHI
jgi:hypothetical protein